MEFIVVDIKNSYLVKGDSFDLKDYPGVEIGSLLFDPNSKKVYRAFKDGFVELGEKEEERELVTKFLVTGLPTGAVASEEENGALNIFCPENTNFTLQQVGANGDKNSYYFGLKIYAPNDEVTGFKESIGKELNDNTLYDFSGDYAGIESDGRKYSIVWLPLAAYNTETEAWTYHGAKSNTTKLVGWDYIVEWYKGDELIANATKRINLTNETCR